MCPQMASRYTHVIEKHGDYRLCPVAEAIQMASETPEKGEALVPVHSAGAADPLIGYHL
jgi:hypothetical protein